MGARSGAQEVSADRAARRELREALDDLHALEVEAGLRRRLSRLRWVVAVVSRVGTDAGGVLEHDRGLVDEVIGYVAPTLRGAGASAVGDLGKPAQAGGLAGAGVEPNHNGHGHRLLNSRLALLIVPSRPASTSPWR